MKITVSSLPIAKASAVNRINAHFNAIAAAELQREQAWRRKREIAIAVSSDGEATFAFAQDAERADMTIPQFAEFILAKQDPAEIADAREDARQDALHAVDAADSFADIQAICAAL